MVLESNRNVLNVQCFLIIGPCSVSDYWPTTTAA